MTIFIRISAAQADSLRGNYDPWHALDPIALPDTDDYILTDTVLTHPAYAAAVDTLKALPTYPKWKSVTVYATGEIIEYGDKLWSSVVLHTSKAASTPDKTLTEWKSAHLTDALEPGDKGGISPVEPKVP